MKKAIALGIVGLTAISGAKLNTFANELNTNLTSENLQKVNSYFAVDQSYSNKQGSFEAKFDLTNTYKF